MRSIGNFVVCVEISKNSFSHASYILTDRYRLHKDELDAIADPEARYNRLVELNVIEQVLNLFKTGVVQRRRVHTFNKGKSYPTPRIHACVFDPRTGDLKRLPVRNQASLNVHAGNIFCSYLY